MAATASGEHGNFSIVWLRKVGPNDHIFIGEQSYAGI